MIAYLMPYVGGLVIGYVWQDVGHRRGWSWLKSTGAAVVTVWAAGILSYLVWGR